MTGKQDRVNFPPVRTIVVTVLLVFLLNEVWELAQMPFYVPPPGSNWRRIIWHCTRAAVGDIGIVFSIYALGTLAAGNPNWSLSGKRNVYVATSVLGMFCAALFEWWALSVNRWEYAESMPLIPVLRVGLLPVLQMAILPPLILAIVRRWTLCSSTKRADSD